MIVAEVRRTTRSVVPVRIVTEVAETWVTIPTISSDFAEARCRAIAVEGTIANAASQTMTERMRDEAECCFTFPPGKKRGRTRVRPLWNFCGCRWLLFKASSCGSVEVGRSSGCDLDHVSRVYCSRSPSDLP